MVKFFIDLMGGDYAPDEIIKGVQKYLSETTDPDVVINLFGVEEVNEKYKHLFKDKNVKWHISKDFIGMSDKPVETLQKKTNTTIQMALNCAMGDDESVVISAGSTGGFVASSVLTLGLIEGVRRPAIITTIPTLNGSTAILDLGANMDPKLCDFLVYAKIGKIYAQNTLGKQTVKIGLLNVGEEKGKGPKLIQEAHQLLQEQEENFIGNVEGNEVFRGVADVVVCEGFVGNILLKWGEGLVEIIKDRIHKMFETIFKGNGSYIFWNEYLNFFKEFNYNEYGGALLVGVNGYCIVCHGRSKKEAIANAFKKGQQYVKSGIINKIKEFFSSSKKISTDE